MSEKNYKVSICLSKFKNAVILDTKRKKVKCIVIPIEENNIFISKKGLAYLNLYANPYEIVEEDGYTHELVLAKRQNKSPYKSKKKIMGYMSENDRYQFVVKKESDIIKMPYGSQDNTSGE